MKNETEETETVVIEGLEGVDKASLAELVVEVENARKERKAQKAQKKKAAEEGQLGSSRGVETLFKTAYRVNMDLSALADTKSNIMISINGLMITILLGSFSTKIDTNAYVVLPTAVLLVGCLISMIFAVQAARPRLNSIVLKEKDFQDYKKVNVLFFGNFSQLDEPAFSRVMTRLLQDPNAIYTTMIRDLYGVGSVLEVKYKLLRKAYTAFLISLIAGVISFLLTYVVSAGWTGDASSAKTEAQVAGGFAGEGGGK